MRLCRSLLSKPVPYLEAAQGDRFEALYVLALTTGMRLGEFLGLRWQDVNLTAGRLQVHHTLLRLRDGLRLTEPKMPRSR
jgi:integrase